MGSCLIAYMYELIKGYNLVFVCHCQQLPGSMLGFLPPTHGIEGLGCQNEQVTCVSALALVAKADHMFVSGVTG